MALTVTLQQVDAAIFAGRPATLQVNITNTAAVPVALNTLFVVENTESDCTITQPNFLTPNVAVGAGNPTILAGATASYTFKVVFQSPNGPGVSPTTYPSPIGAFVGQPPGDQCSLLVTATASDGSVGQATILAFPLSAVAPFPQVVAGTLQLQFQSGFNLIGLAVGL